MIRSRRAALTPALGILLLLAGCGGSGKPFNDTPAIIGLFPSTAAAGGQAFTMNISGTGFIATSVAYWNNSARTTTFNPNSTQLSVSVTAQDIAAAGTAQVTVVNPSPGGGASTAVAFTITPANNSVPAISSLSPSSTAVGVQPPGGILTVNGSNFIASSSVAFNGVARSSTFVNSSQLTAPMTPSDVAANATIQVTVTNPAPGGGVSNAVPFTVGTGSAVHRRASLASALQSPLVVSVSAVDGPANGQSAAPAISADGRFIAFYSTATNLAGKGPSGNIFVRDTCLGAADCTPRTIAADLAPDGSAPNGIAAPHVALSSDGRFVAFASDATNLVAGTHTAASQRNIYVRDLCIGGDVPAGCTPGTEMVSIGANSESANDSSSFPSLSADGRFVAFASPATNLGSAANGEAQVYVRDTCAGATVSPACVPRTMAASVDGKGQIFAQGATLPAISADGRYVALVAEHGASAASGASTGEQVLLRDTCLGADAPPKCIPSTVTVSLAAGDSVLGGISGSPSLSADGRFVVFASRSASGIPSVFLRDTCLGSASGTDCMPSTTMISVNATAPFIGSSGRYISFVAGSSGASANVPGAGYLHVYDTCFGATGTCTAQDYAISAFMTGSQGEPLAVDAATPAPLLPGGSLIAFFTSALLPNLPLSGHGDVLLTKTPF